MDSRLFSPVLKFVDMKLFILIAVCGSAFSNFAGNELDNGENLTEVQEAFIKFGLDREFPILPQNKLTIHYNTDVKVHLGTEMNIKTIQEIPAVIYEADPDTYYTLIMVDVDSPTKETPFFGQQLIWKVVNIRGSKVHKGETIVEYSAHAPWKKGAPHRFVLFLFKQRHKQVFNDGFLPSTHSFHARIGFNVLKFSMRYGLGRPIAGNFFLLGHDENIRNEIFRHHTML